MQLMPETAGQMYVEDPVDPAQNIMGGTRYLRQLANEFGGDMMLVLAAYNAGPDAVRKYKGVPPYDETRQYVKKVLDYYYQLKRAAKRTQVADSAQGPAPARGSP
jgi:soluble lytic murein transglycosylase-like protein